MTTSFQRVAHKHRRDGEEAEGRKGIHTLSLPDRKPHAGGQGEPFYSVQPLRPRRRLFDRPGKLRRDELREGASRRPRPECNGPDLTALEAERLTIRDMVNLMESRTIGTDNENALSCSRYDCRSGLRTR
jgi:hypothetical protein